MTAAAAPDRDGRAGDYVLGAMDGAEAVAFEAEMARDPTLGGLVAEWRDRLRELDETAVTEPAGEQLWRRIEASLGPAPMIARKPSAERAWARWWDNLAFWRSCGVAAAAAAVLLAVGLAVSLQRAAPAPSMVAVLTAESDGRPLALVEIGADGTSRLVAIAAIPVPEGRALEVWTLPGAEAAPVSIGLLDRPRSLSLDTGSLPPARVDQLFAISLEPATGSPTGQPTGPILIKGLAKPAL
jgi:anti-sigma-K factor RskA